VVELSNEVYEEEVLKSDVPVLMDFWASWCHSCDAFAEIFNDAESRYPGIKFAKVKVDDFRELARKYRVMSLPCLVLVRKGEVLEFSAGFKNEDGIHKMLERHI
jgi:thioredoxin 1